MASWKRFSASERKEAEQRGRFASRSEQPEMNCKGRPRYLGKCSHSESKGMQLGRNNLNFTGGSDVRLIAINNKRTRVSNAGPSLKLPHLKAEKKGRWLYSGSTNAER